MVLKYEVNEELIPEYIEDLKELMDWSPLLIQGYISFIKVDEFGYRNPEKYFKICREHKRKRDQYEDSDESKILHPVDWEVEVFLRKYPYFKPLFRIREDYVEPEIPKEEPKKGFFKRLFSKNK